MLCDIQEYTDLYSYCPRPASVLLALTPVPLNYIVLGIGAEYMVWSMLYITQQVGYHLFQNWAAGTVTTLYHSSNEEIVHGL